MRKTLLGDEKGKKAIVEDLGKIVAYAVKRERGPDKGTRNLRLSVELLESRESLSY